MVRLKDVARIELGADCYDRSGKVNGAPVSGMGVYLQSGANALNTAKLVKARLEEMSKNFPKGMEYFVPYDTTRFIQESAKEVLWTLGEAALLVIAVVYVFLQNWRATLIPIVAVPVSLVGTFAGMWLFGFSINTLTLFAMVLAIGIVVDDAIVVLENVERLMNEQKMSPKDAAIEAMRDGRASVFFAMGGNFAAATPDTPTTWAALQRCALTVPVAPKSNRSHTVHGEQALVLPCLGRTEIDVQAAGPQAVTVEDSMSMVHLSAGINDPASPD